MPPRRPRFSFSAGLGVSALAAAVVAAMRYRDRGIAASFDKPLSDGTTRVFLYATADHWYSHYELWLAVGVVLSAASILVALLARRV